MSDAAEINVAIETAIKGLFKTVFNYLRLLCISVPCIEFPSRSFYFPISTSGGAREEPHPSIQWDQVQHSHPASGAGRTLMNKGNT